MDDVGAGAAAHPVLAVAAGQDVVARPAVHGVLVVVALDVAVVAVAAADDVVAVAALHDGVVVVAAPDAVVAGPAMTLRTRRASAASPRRGGNREIGQLLFMSASTVEGHLTRTYRKLAIRSRSELARLMAEGLE